MRTASEARRHGLVLLSFCLLSFGLPVPGLAQSGGPPDPLVQDLLRAVQRESIDEVRRLLDAGAPANGDALFLALNAKDLQIARMLLDQGADPDSEPTLMPGVGSSLAFFSGTGKLDAVQLLLERGADPNRLSAEGRVAPLMMAAMQNRVEVAEALLAAGADPSLPVGPGGDTAMEWAAAVGVLSGDKQMAEAMARRSPEGEELLLAIEGGRNIDGTRQDGSLTLTPDQPTYPAGTFTGPCLSRREPAMDPAHPQPGASGSGAYRETHVSFVGGMKVGTIAPPDCEPLQLAPAQYEVTVLGGNVSWVWVCPEGGGDCPFVRKEETFDDRSNRFEVGVEPARGEVEEESPDECRVESIEIVSPARGHQVSYDGSPTGTLELTAQAEPRPSDCDQELQWTIEDIGSVSARIETGGDGGGNGATFIFQGLPEENEDFGPKQITVTVGGRTDTLSVEVFFRPTEFNHPGSQGTPNWFYYWGKTLAGMGVSLEHRATLVSETVPGLEVPGQYIFAEDQIYLSDLAYSSSCTQRPPGFGGESMKGIDCFAELVRHEHQHQVERREWWGAVDPKAARQAAEDACGSVPYSLCDEFQDYKNDMDWDLDLVPNRVEQQLAGSRGCDWQDRASCAGRPAGTIDLELNAYNEGWAWIKGGADREDWSWCGKQWTDASVCPGRQIW